MNMIEKLKNLDNELSGSFNWGMAKEETFKENKVIRNRPYDTFEQLYITNPTAVINLVSIGEVLINEEGID